MAMLESTTRILRASAALIGSTGFTARRCAADRGGHTVHPGSPDAASYCVSGAARRVSGFLDDDGGGSQPEQEYVAAMDAFCAHVGTPTVMEWADHPGRTAEEVVATLRAAADAQQERKRLDR